MQIKDAAGKVVYDRPAIEELIRWRLWDRTGAGLMAELGSHQLDAASIFIHAMHKAHDPKAEKPHPLSVAAAADRPLFPADRDVEDHVYCVIEFPAPGYDAEGPLRQPQEDRRAVRLDQRQRFRRLRRDRLRHQGDADPGTGAGAVDHQGAGGAEQRQGVRRRGRRADAGHAGQRRGRRPAAKSGGGAKVSRGYTEELEHWAWCIRHPRPENQPRCGPKVALGDAVIALTTNMAARKGQRIEFKKEWFDIRQRRDAGGRSSQRSCELNTMSCRVRETHQPRS